MLRGSFDAEDAFIKFRDIYVNLDDAPLGPHRFNDWRHQGFQSFARPASSLPEPDVFHRLLCQRRGAAIRAFLNGGTQLRHVEPPMEAEIRILGGNNGLKRLWGDCIGRNPVATYATKTDAFA